MGPFYHASPGNKQKHDKGGSTLEVFVSLPMEVESLKTGAWHQIFTVINDC